MAELSGQPLMQAKWIASRIAIMSHLEIASDKRIYQHLFR